MGELAQGPCLGSVVKDEPRTVVCHPQKAGYSDAVEVVRKLTTSATFLGTGEVPSSENTYPKNSNLSFLNSHLLLLRVRPFYVSHWNRALRFWLFFEHLSKH